MKQLVIAEKPSVARDLAQVLQANQKHKNYYEGNQYVVTWALGHLLGLKMPEDIDKAKWQKWQLATLPMLPKHIGIKPLKGARGQLGAISQLAKRKDVNSAVIATDAGREGELVARFILQYIRFSKPVWRLWISSQTKKAVKQGFANLKPAKAYDNLFASALARAKADWLVGLNVSRALTVKYDDNLSAGRVQTPTLALVAQRDAQIARFKPQSYYQIKLAFHSLTAKMKQEKTLTSKQAAQALVKKMRQLPAKITQVSTKEKRKTAPLPYDLTLLQREANVKYGYSAKKTLNLVQSLYEHHKVVSYPRTDSQYLSTDLVPSFAERLRACKNIAPDKVAAALKNHAKMTTKAVNNAKVTDHHALIPTEEMPDYAKFSNDEARIYQMISRRFIDLFAKPLVQAETTATISVGEFEFNVKQTHVKAYGYLDAPQATPQALVKLAPNQPVLGQFILEEKQTTPPKPMSEAALLQAMEKNGLGTPATRAEIIEKLITTDLMERTNNALIVKPKGKQLLKLVNKALVSPALTAKWEQQLEQIAHGKYAAQKFMADIVKTTKRLVNEIKNAEIAYHDFNLTQKKCPECDHFLKQKTTKQGKMLVCSNRECNYRRFAEAKVTNHRCPTCHKKMLLLEKNGQQYFRCKYDGTTEKLQGKKARSTKPTKHETRKVMKRLQQEADNEESPLAAALKAAMAKNGK